MRVKLTFKNIDLKQAQKLCQYAKKNKITVSQDDIKVEPTRALPPIRRALT